MNDIFTNDQLDWLGLVATDETMGIMADKTVHLYALKEDEDTFVSNYDIINNKVLDGDVWCIFRNADKRTNMLYFTQEFLESDDNPVKWLLQSLILHDKING